MPNKEIYTVATAHLDTIWNWDFETTVSKYIYNTLVNNFKLFKKYPDYRFNFEGTYRYELMQEYYPEEFEKLKDYVKSGQWNVCGSAFENGDVNIPSPEALFRNILIGNSYFDKTFNKRSKDIYLPDCFGFGWALPSIAAHSNLYGFSTQKLAWGSAYGTPFDIGVWQGVDGNSILASINPHDYYYTLTKLRDWDFVQNKLRDNEKYSLDKTMIYHGIGDRGGSPEEKSVALVDSERKSNDSSDVKVKFSAADELFNDIHSDFSQEQIDKLPKWDTELVMRDHAVGGYTSRAVSKRWNRRCEELADVAERLSVAADVLGTEDYNKNAITEEWKRFIRHQFHDDIPGTSVQRAYLRSWNDYAMAMNRLSGEAEAAQVSLSQLMKTDFCTGTPIMVSNAVEHSRHGAVTIHLPGIKTTCVRVYDEKGREVKSQVNWQRGGITEIVFIADVGAYGIRVYDVRESDVPCKLKGSLTISTENIMENQKYLVALNRKGNITSIIDKEQDEREILEEPVSLGLFKYNGSKTWPAWEMNYDEANKDADSIPNITTITVQESGPARVAFCVQQNYKGSTFKNVIALTDGSNVVEVYSQIEWRELKTMAKNKFAFKCKNEKATFDLGLGAIQRKNMDSVLYEVPAQKWADITDESGEWGVSVISECKYGWDKYKDNTLRMTVLHTPKHDYRIDSKQSMMDLGLNRYSYALFSHVGKVGADTQKEARVFIQPMTAVSCSKHAGVMGTSQSFIKTSDDSVIIRAIKAAEDSDEIVVRLNEGADSTVGEYSLSLFDGIESARELYASEEFMGDAQVRNGELITSFKPYQVRTFALTLKPVKVQGEKVHTYPVDTAADKKLITAQGEKGDFKLCIPAEIIGDTITVNGMSFSVSKAGMAAVCCNQAIKLSGKCNKLAFLIASDFDKTLRFTVDGKAVDKNVYSITEHFAQWDMYGLGKTAYIKQGKLGYIASHSHTDGKDNYAKELYFYLLTIDISAAKEVVLPDDSGTVILSACEVSGACGDMVTPVYDSAERREFTYKMPMWKKLYYAFLKPSWNVVLKKELKSDDSKDRTDY